MWARDLWDTAYAPVWRFVGQHARFNARIENMASELVRGAFGLGFGEEMPPVSY